MVPRIGAVRSSWIHVLTVVCVISHHIITITGPDMLIDGYGKEYKSLSDESTVPGGSQ